MATEDITVVCGVVFAPRPPPLEGWALSLAVIVTTIGMAEMSLATLRGVTDRWYAPWEVDETAGERWGGIVSALDRMKAGDR